DRGEVFGVLRGDVLGLPDGKPVGGQHDRVLGTDRALHEFVEQPVQITGCVVGHCASFSVSFSSFLPSSRPLRVPCWNAVRVCRRRVGRSMSLVDGPVSGEEAVSSVVSSHNWGTRFTWGMRRGSGGRPYVAAGCGRCGASAGEEPEGAGGVGRRAAPSVASSGNVLTPGIRRGNLGGWAGAW